METKKKKLPVGIEMFRDIREHEADLLLLQILRPVGDTLLCQLQCLFAVQQRKAAAVCAAGRRGVRCCLPAPRHGGAAGAAVHRLGAGAGGPGILDGAVQGARCDPYPPCTDAVALCVCADQLYAAAGAGKTHDPGEEKRPCGIPLNTTKRSAITKCW
mgnify:CR=1 FL=1